MYGVCGSLRMVIATNPAHDCECVRRVVGLATVADSHLQHVQCHVIQ